MPPTPAEPDGLRRRRTLLAGHRAERIALLLLALKGYRPLARRYAVRGGEIDLVCIRGRTVIFAEVKARPRLEDALTAVTPAQRRRIARAAAVWLTRNPWAARLTLRCDLIAIAPWRWPLHVTDAFQIASPRKFP